MAEEPERMPAAPGPRPAASRPRPLPGSRTPEQIRADIEREREALGQSMEALRNKVAEVTDWRSQVRKHKRELAIGAAVVGFAIGFMAMRRRGRD
ncbi:MAG TPA: DUF3618 domain-containing protein [Solirubrobacterales bacterium]